MGATGRGLLSLRKRAAGRDQHVISIRQVRYR